MHLSRPLFAGLFATLALLSPLAALAQDSYPVTIEHALGETVIAAKPQRIVTIGWMTQDAVLALGEVPVGIPLQLWGGDAEGVLPWVREAVDALGGPMPAVINFDNGVPYEDVLAVDPDLILAPYSGLTQEEYDRLAAIAPTVAYASAPWAGSWQDVVTTTGIALDKQDEAAAIIAGIDAQFAALAAEHPEFAGKTFTFGSLWAGDDGMNVYSATDPRIPLVSQLGFVPSPGVIELSREEGYLFTVSFENLDTIDADVLILLDEGDAAADALYANELVQRFAPVADGRLLRMTDKSFVMATSAPSPLSIPWMLDEFVPGLAALLD